jgi:hypothetical protein
LRATRAPAGRGRPRSGCPRPPLDCLDVVVVLLAECDQVGCRSKPL